MTLPPEALDGLTRTWAAILQARHPQLGRIEVSVVEDERTRDPAPVATRRKVNRLAAPDERQPPIQGGRAA